MDIRSAIARGEHCGGNPIDISSAAGMESVGIERKRSKCLRCAGMPEVLTRDDAGDKAGDVIEDGDVAHADKPNGIELGKLPILPSQWWWW